MHKQLLTVFSRKRTSSCTFELS